MSKRILGFQATDCHRWHVWAALSCFIHEKLTGFLICELQQCLRSVNHHQYLGQIKGNSKFTNLRFKKWLEIIALGDFSNETPEERKRWIEIQCEQRRRRRQQEKAEQREHRLAQRRQHRPQETEEQWNRRLENQWQSHQQETEEQRNRRLEYQRQYQGRRRLHVNNLSNITLSNEEPLSHETPQQQENRLQISKRNR